MTGKIAADGFWSLCQNPFMLTKKTDLSLFPVADGLRESALLSTNLMA